MNSDDHEMDMVDSEDDIEQNENPVEEKCPIGNKSDRTLKITNLKNEIRDFECPILGSDLLPIGHFSSTGYPQPQGRNRVTRHFIGIPV
jgi:hypothetical protein